MPAFQHFLGKIEQGEFVRVVAFGSSNTERRFSGMHWFDCFELTCRARLGKMQACINSGWGGHTTVNLLERIERDCLIYQPGLVFLTIGGNDCNPAKNVTTAEFRQNLPEIVRRVRQVGGEVVFQTYYSFDLDNMDPVRGQRFHELMDIVREVAAETNSSLIDHLKRWEPLRLQYPDIYRRLMADAAHVTPTGNLLLGADIVRHFGLALPDDPFFREALALQALLDRIEL